MSRVALEFPPELIDVIAQRAAELIAEQKRGGEGWLREAGEIGEYIGAPRSRVYALANCNPSRIPVHRDGSTLVAKRSELDAWMRSGGGKRP